MSPVEPVGAANPDDLDPVLWSRKLVEIGDRIARLLSTDAREYFEQTVRQVFVGAPSLADRLDDAALAALKADVRAAAQAAALGTLAALTDDAWLAATPPDDDSAPVDAHAPVAEAMRAVSEAVVLFLRRHALPAEAEAWTPPARFIGGEHLSTLTRSLWRAVARRDAALHQQQARQTHDDATARARRWDEA